jgi:hypothetical protein
MSSPHLLSTSRAKTSSPFTWGCCGPATVLNLRVRGLSAATTGKETARISINAVNDKTKALNIYSLHGVGMG